MKGEWVMFRLKGKPGVDARLQEDRDRSWRRALLDELGVRSPVLVRSGPQLAAVVAAKPYSADGKAVSVTFLAGPPSAAAVRAVDPAAYGTDEFVVIGSEIYLHTPGGYGRTKLNNAFWERKLSTIATTRNWNTVLALAEMTS